VLFTVSVQTWSIFSTEAESMKCMLPSLVAICLTSLQVSQTSYASSVRQNANQLASRLQTNGPPGGSGTGLPPGSTTQSGTVRSGSSGASGGQP
jgi:hypothetical protein